MGLINSQLDGVTASVFTADIGWRIATDGDGDGVDGLLAISGGNYQLTALCGVGSIGAAIVSLDLQRRSAGLAGRYACWHVTLDGGVAPTYIRQVMRNAIGPNYGYRSGSLGHAESIVAS